MRFILVHDFWDEDDYRWCENRCDEYNTHEEAMHAMLRMLWDIHKCKLSQEQPTYKNVRLIPTNFETRGEDMMNEPAVLKYFEEQRKHEEFVIWLKEREKLWDEAADEDRQRALYRKLKAKFGDGEKDEL